MNEKMLVSAIIYIETGSGTREIMFRHEKAPLQIISFPDFD